MPSQASMVLHSVGSTILPPFSSPPKLLCTSVDASDLLATTSPLRLHHDMRLKHRQFFTKSALRSSTLFLVEGTTVQERGHASSNLYYITVAFPFHYAVLSIDGSSQSRHCDLLTGAAIFYGGSRTFCYQNPLVGFFNVDFDFFAFLRTRALGLQVKLLYGSLLSLATSIFCHVLVVFVYQFTVENLSGCNRLSPLDF
ncbi:unnamed protein product [Brassica oleracea]